MANFSETAEAEIEVVSNSEEIYTALLTPPGESEDHYQELKPTGKSLKLINFRPIKLFIGVAEVSTPTVDNMPNDFAITKCENPQNFYQN